MSGSGGGNGGGPNPPDSRTDCANLVDRTILNSPDPAVLKKLRVKDVLQITLNKARVLLAVTHDGETAGSITSARMLQFINCIEKGFGYVAVVRALSSGRCEVEIRPESK